MDTTIIEQFARVLAGPEAVITDPQVLTTAGHDYWGFGGTPGLLLRPGSRDEVVAVMQLATTHQIPVVPRGGASNCSAGRACRRSGGVALLRRRRRWSQRFRFQHAGLHQHAHAATKLRARADALAAIRAGIDGIEAEFGL